MMDFASLTMVLDVVPTRRATCTGLICCYRGSSMPATELYNVVSQSGRHRVKERLYHQGPKLYWKTTMRIKHPKEADDF